MSTLFSFPSKNQLNAQGAVTEIIFGTLVSTHQYSKTCLQGTSLYKRRCPYITGVNQVSLHHRFLNLGEAGGGGGGWTGKDGSPFPTLGTIIKQIF